VTPFLKVTGAEQDISQGIHCQAGQHSEFQPSNHQYELDYSPIHQHNAFRRGQRLAYLKVV
jgi:hypothetical protein